ncbi:hypothetical protein B0H14DRAFT_3858645 [Mycena olivaceomarginata]|nr:hypothetical protein B0H14DRAFT_3858645 [Mycena olivaceomarginata]
MAPTRMGDVGMRTSLASDELGAAFGDPAIVESAFRLPCSLLRLALDGHHTFPNQTLSLAGDPLRDTPMDVESDAAAHGPPCSRQLLSIHDAPFSPDPLFDSALHPSFHDALSPLIAHDALSAPALLRAHTPSRAAHPPHALALPLPFPPFSSSSTTCAPRLPLPFLTPLVYKTPPTFLHTPVPCLPARLAHTPRTGHAPCLAPFAPFRLAPCPQRRGETPLFMRGG